MCLISIAPKGTNKYSEFFINSLRCGAKSNTQGMGYSYKKEGNNNEVFISKGYFHIERLIESIIEAKLEEGDELMVHQRIGTSGKMNEENCHPFVISGKQDEILITEGWVSKPTLVHNGIFREYAYKNSIYSDTYHFVHEFMSNKRILEFFKEDIEEFQMVFYSIDFLSWNKVAILFPDKGIIYNEGFTEDSGYLFSNKGYCDNTIKNVGGKETKPIPETTFSPSLPKEDEEEEFELPKESRTLVPLNNNTEEPKHDYLDSLKNSIANLFAPKKIDNIVLPLHIAVTEKNYNQLMLVSLDNFNKFKKGDIVEVMSFRKNTEVYVKKVKDNVDLVLLSEVDIRKNFNIFAKRESARKFAEYKRMVNTCINQGKNFQKRLEKITSRCKDPKLKIGNYGSFEREAVLEYLDQLRVGFNPILSFETLELQKN